ncbi:MAG: 1,4-dihydroxy-2-naphthoate octaprenyltransferase [Marinirhabdus sp.]
MGNFRVWLSAARLRTLPLSLSGIVTGAAMAWREHVFAWQVFVLAMLTTLGLQVLSNFANDYGDGIKGTDNADRVGPARALQSGLLTAQQFKKGIVVCTVITLGLACWLIYVAFGTDDYLFSIVFFMLGLLAIVSAIKYTVGKWAYGYRAMGDVFVFVFFGLVGVCGSYFLFAKQLGWLHVLPAVTVGLLSTAVLNLNNMRDRLADAKVNKNTLAVLLGESRSKTYHTLLIFFAFVSATAYFVKTSSAFVLFIPLLALVPLFVHVIKVYKNEAPPLLDPELKKVALGTFAFSVLFFVAALIAG